MLPFQIPYSCVRIIIAASSRIHWSVTITICVLHYKEFSRQESQKYAVGEQWK